MDIAQPSPNAGPASLAVSQTLGNIKPIPSYLLGVVLVYHAPENTKH